MIPQGHEAYQASAVETASPEQLTLMCYDGAIRFMRRAIVAYEAQNRARASESVGRAQAIINELAITLNMEEGGEIAQNLRELYAFVNRHLGEAVIAQDTTMIETAIGLIQPIRDSWAQAMNLDQQQAA